MFAILKDIMEARRARKYLRDKGQFCSLDSRTKVGGRCYLYCRERDLMFTTGPFPTPIGCSDTGHHHHKLFIQKTARRK